MKLLEKIAIHLDKETVSPIKIAGEKGIISTDYLPKFICLKAKTIQDAIFLLKTYGEKSTLIASGTTLLRELSFWIGNGSQWKRYKFCPIKKISL